MSIVEVAAFLRDCFAQEFRIVSEAMPAARLPLTKLSFESK